MRDVETELRNLYEDIEVRTPTMSRDAIRRIKTRRGSKMILLGAVITSSILGISFAAGFDGSGQAPSQPATQPSAISTPVIMVASTDDSQTTIALQRDLGIVCHVGSPNPAGLESLQIVRANRTNTPIIELFPPASRVADTRGNCTGDVSAATIDAIVAAPNEFLLSQSIEGEPRVLSQLFLLTASPSPAERCSASIRFEPTYLPPDWSKEIHPGGGPNNLPGEVLGHYGSDAPRTSRRYKKAGLASLMTWPSAQFDGADADLEVLGEGASLVKAGTANYVITFTYRGCGYALFGVDVSKRVLIDFARGLVPVDTSRT